MVYLVRRVSKIIKKEEAIKLAINTLISFSVGYAECKTKEEYEKLLSNVRQLLENEVKDL
jgi:hypothetical protein